MWQSIFTLSSLVGDLWYAAVRGYSEYCLLIVDMEHDEPS